jgi:hypothetical protein
MFFAQPFWLLTKVLQYMYTSTFTEDFLDLALTRII